MATQRSNYFPRNNPVCSLIFTSSFLFQFLVLFLASNKFAEAQTRDVRWPNRQLNVMVDLKSINETERQILTAFFDQVEHKTCIKVHKLNSDTINPFDAAKYLQESEQNFIYIFKSQFGSLSNRNPAALGLSSLGCVQQGRQSLVLSDMAFRWPELVLRYHILRSLGLSENLKRPDDEVRQLLSALPLSQKIDELPKASLSPIFNPMPAYFAYANAPSAVQEQQHPEPRQQVKYLSEEDLSALKDLYNCSDYQNRLSVKPLNELAVNSSGNSLELDQKSVPLLTNGEPRDTFNRPNAEAKEQAAGNKVVPEVEETLIDEAAKSIASHLISSESNGDQAQQQRQQFQEPIATSVPDIDSMFNESSPEAQQQQCNPMDLCPVTFYDQQQGRSAKETKETSSTSSGATDESPSSERPMLLKLDQFHAHDPHLQQANQMKLSQLGNNSFATYRLMSAPENVNQAGGFQSQQQASYNGNSNNYGPLQPPTPPQGLPNPAGSSSKSEVLISFEQSPAAGSGGNPVAALASSQVLKLCSCTCQTMAPIVGPPQPSPFPPPPPPPSTMEPPASQSTGFPPTFKPPATEPQPGTIVVPTLPPTEPPSTEIPKPPSPTPTLPPMTGSPSLPPMTSFPPITEPPPPPFNSVPTTIQPTATSSSTNIPTQPSNEGALNVCDQVQWIRPNKSVYESPKIVWDVDRANQNYFLCNNLVDGELIPGKTHGFSCKIGSKGASFEMHNFNVLIKPENVSLAWVQRNSNSFGKTNLPVVGGFSKEQDPYIVSRCLVEDENRNVITLIGYVNNKGVGWFPFDSIQIECDKYDVLACVS